MVELGLGIIWTFGWFYLCWAGDMVVFGDFAGLDWAAVLLVL